MTAQIKTDANTNIKSHDDVLQLAPDDIQLTEEKQQTSKPRPEMEIVWGNVIKMGILHAGAIYGLYIAHKAKLSTLIWSVLVHWASGLGITVGAHRLWAHRSYKAKLPYRIMMALLNTSACQNDVIEWSRDHRVHHKFSETDADPHNAKRGFFFAHVGWLMVRKHPDVIAKGKLLDLSDLYNDPVLRIQRKFYKPSVILLAFVFPIIVPVYFFGESLITAYFVSGLLRYCMTLNSTWLVNSAAHMWGWKPYDVGISPSENPIVSLCAVGEGFHNYHHTFPQDYSTAELGWLLNFSTVFIDFFAFLGQVYDRKSIPKEIVQRRIERTGPLSAMAKTKSM